MEAALGAAGFEVAALTGVVFNPLGEGWRPGRDLDVNYMAAARRPG
jgi:2-polyprenyl-3-methyl-5-hydroxy-6-metoxy-1,4-benzoquinol methylase